MLNIPEYANETVDKARKRAREKGDLRRDLLDPYYNYNGPEPEKIEISQDITKAE